MFKVVQQQQELPFAQVLSQQFPRAPAPRFAYAQRVRDCGWHQTRVMHSREVDERNAVSEGLDQFRGNSYRQPSFPNAAGSHQGDQARGLRGRVQ